MQARRLAPINETAMPFTTSTNALGYHLTSVQLYLNILIGIDIPTPQVSIRGDNAGLPGDTALYTLTTSTAITSSYQLLTFTTSDEVILQPNTKYWLYVSATGGTASVQETASDDEDTESQAGWSIADDRLFRTNGGAWATATANNSLRMKILGHAITPTLVSNLGQTAASTGAQAGFVSGNHHETAMPFTTSTNALGYRLTSIQLYLNRLIGIDIPTPQVSIRGDNAGLPSETVLYTFTTSSAITSSYQLITFTTPDEVKLQPNTKYWLYVSATGGTASVQETASDDEDTESQAGWSIADDRLFRTNGGAWATATANNSLRMKILGHAITPTLVSNLGQTATSTGANAGSSFGTHYETAMSFTTSTNALGYRLTSVQLYLNILIGIDIPTPRSPYEETTPAFPATPRCTPSPRPRQSQVVTSFSRSPHPMKSSYNPTPNIGCTSAPPEEQPQSKRPQATTKTPSRKPVGALPTIGFSGQMEEPGPRPPRPTIACE